MKCFFLSKQRFSPFSHSMWLLLNISLVISKVCITLIKSLCHASQRCICWPTVHWLGAVQEVKYIQGSHNSRPRHALRSCGGRVVHVSTLIQTTYHVDLADQLGCLLVASRSRNLYPCSFPNVKERLKYIYPKSSISIQSNQYIYIYIYKQRPHAELHEVLPCGTLYEQYFI